MVVVNKAVVVIGNENALWCDTVKSFDARTEKLFAATTVKTKREKIRKTKSRETKQKKMNGKNYFKIEWK